MRKFLRIDFYYPRDSVGPNLRVCNLPPRLAKLGLEVHQVCILLSSARPQVLQETHGVQVYYLDGIRPAENNDPFNLGVVLAANLDPEYRRTLVRKILAIVQKIKPDFIEVVDSAYGIGIDVQEASGIPTALFLCMYQLTFRFLASIHPRNYHELLSDFSDAIPRFSSVWSISRYFAGFTRDLGLAPTSMDIRVRYNGVNYEDFQISDLAKPRLNEHRVLCLCRVDPEKGIHNLVTALPLLAKCTSKRVRCTIAGDSVLFPEYRRILEYIAAQQGVEDLNFVGFVDVREKAALLCSSDLYIFPTICPDSGALTVLEAMAAGTPLLVSNTGAAPEYITETTGLCFDSFDTRALADRAAEILERLSFSREEIRKIAQANYSWERSAEATLAHMLAFD